MSHATDLQHLCDEYWRVQCAESLATAIMAGQPVEHDDLLREAPADHERRAAIAKDLLQRADAIATTGLSAQDLASHRMLRRELQGWVDAVAVMAHLRPPLYPMGPDFIVGYIGGLVSLRGEADARRWLARLRRLPAGLAGVVESLQAGIAAGIRYPKLVIERASQQALGLASLPAAECSLYEPFARAAQPSPAFKAVAEAALRCIEDEVYPALRDYAAFVRDRLGAVAQDSPACLANPLGDAYYRFEIRGSTTADLDPAETHRLGLAEVARIEARMQEVASGAGFAGDLPGFLARLKDDPAQFAPSGEALLDQMAVLSKRIDGLLPEYFGRLPRMSYGLRLIPPAVAEKQPPAYAQPNPADKGTAGVHWVTSLPRKCPRYMHIPLALHEAWPGHLMHIALMQELDGLPAFRRYGASKYSACLEGWALYCEFLGEEMGLYDTPEKLYGRLEMEMWRALRLVVDTGLHALGWSRQQAIDKMAQHMAMPLVTIEAEVDRYIAWPGQALAYQVGNLKFRELRRRAESRQGAQFDRRAFHDTLMAAGPVTLEVLDDMVERWIAATASPTPAEAAAGH